MSRRICGLKNPEFRRAGEVLEILYPRYPMLREYPRKPLAIGTSDRLVEAAAELGLTASDIQVAMRRYTAERSYLTAIAQCGPRYNLAGEVEGEVDSSHAKYAQNRINLRVAIEAAALARRKNADRRGPGDHPAGRSPDVRLPEAGKSPGDMDS